MFPFDVILFDVGGVLLTNGWDHRERAAAWSIFTSIPRRSRPGICALRCLGAGRDFMKAYLDATVFYEPRSFFPRRLLCGSC